MMESSVRSMSFFTVRNTFARHERCHGTQYFPIRGLREAVYFARRTVKFSPIRHPQLLCGCFIKVFSLSMHLNLKENDGLKTCIVACGKCNDTASKSRLAARRCGEVPSALGIGIAISAGSSGEARAA